MTKQDFELIARVLETVRYSADHEAIAERFADALARVNPRFDRARFLKAAGLPVAVRA